MCEHDAFPLPLFHGTSTWFLPNIIQHGLGGLNVHEGLRSREFLRDVWDLWREQGYAEQPDRLAPYIAIPTMIADQISAGGFNFRYGQFYCTANEGQAVQYATSNAFGSELVSEAAKLLKEVRSDAPAKADALLAEYPELKDCLMSNHEPVVVRLDGVVLCAVRNEDGTAFTGENEKTAKFLSFVVEPNAHFAAMSVFRVDIIESDNFGVRRHQLVPLKEDQ